MQNVIDHSHLTSATAEGGRRSRNRVPRIRREGQRRRERKIAAPSLVTLGSLVIPARNFSKRRVLVEGQPSLGSARRPTPPPAVKQVSIKLSAISSRSLEQTWLDEHRAEYAGAWVALEGASLVAHGASARQVLDAAMSAGYDQPLVVHVPSELPLPFGGG